MFRVGDKVKCIDFDGVSGDFLKTYADKRGNMFTIFNVYGKLVSLCENIEEYIEEYEYNEDEKPLFSSSRFERVESKKEKYMTIEIKRCVTDYFYTHNTLNVKCKVMGLYGTANNVWDLRDISYVFKKLGIIDSIKYLRAMNDGLGLKDAKDIVEDYRAMHNITD